MINFSGCPGGSKADKTPNCVTCPWPPDFLEILDYQWNKVLIPFWTKENEAAENAGVKIAFEAHPGFCVYNPETLSELRKRAGKHLGANLDPSHFFWQGIDPVEAARFLGEAKCIFHVHAKDTAIDPHNSRITGNLDIKSYGDVANRSLGLPHRAATATATSSGSRSSPCSASTATTACCPSSTRTPS